MAKASRNVAEEFARREARTGRIRNIVNALTVNSQVVAAGGAPLVQSDPNRPPQPADPSAPLPEGSRLMLQVGPSAMIAFEPGDDAAEGQALRAMLEEVLEPLRERLMERAIS